MVTAARTSIRPARRAGITAATTPAAAATIAIAARIADRQHEGEPLVGEQRRDDAGQRQPRRDAEPGADERGEDALPAHHPPHLAPGHAGRAQQADLPRALDDRQRERVDDAEQADDDGQCQHHDDDRQHLVQPRRLIARPSARVTARTRRGTRASRARSPPAARTMRRRPVSTSPKRASCVRTPTGTPPTAASRRRRRGRRSPGRRVIADDARGHRLRRRRAQRDAVAEARCR